MDYVINRKSKVKKRILIEVHPNGVVEVKAPRFVSQKQVQKVVESNIVWIEKQKQKYQTQKESYFPYQYLQGEEHYFLGERYSLNLEIVSAGKNQVALFKQCFHIQTQDLNKVEKLLDIWYKQQAKTIFTQRLTSLIKHTPWVNEIPPIKIRKMKTRWGSCSHSGNINLNLHLVKAPIDCIDYVIVHELCHLKEFNHSRRFYALMSKAMPNWLTIKNQLQQFTFLLSESRLSTD